MVPWARVRWLPATADIGVVLAQVSQERLSRWPVVDGKSGRPLGYLLAKDLIDRPVASDWLSLLRPLKAIAPDDSIEAVLLSMQNEGASIYAVENRHRLVGLVTLEDILEQVFGQIEDPDPHQPAALLVEAVASGGIVLDLIARTQRAALEELAAAIPTTTLPAGVDHRHVLQLVQARAEQVTTDIGHGVCVAHARCPELRSAIAVFGRSAEGIVLSPNAAPPVHLIILLVTPTDQPEVHLELLRQLASLCNNPSTRDALHHATSPAEFISILDTTSRNTASS
jgi:mannitol/fructose-specific phosphotransferase system IIA component (Ntr-type)